MDHLIDEFADDFEETDPTGEDLGLDSFSTPSTRTVATSTELLTLQLLREAIRSQHPSDLVMADFAEYVLPQLLTYAIGSTAKGGRFFVELDRRRKAAGQTPVRRHNAADQSLSTHLLNGLFPANLIERRLQELGTSVSRRIQEQERRLGMASFILHDFEKFDYQRFAKMPAQYVAIQSDPEQDIRKLPLEDHRHIFTVLVPALGLDRFVLPENPAAWSTYADDLLFVAYNAQRRFDTNLNLSEWGLAPQTDQRALKILADLACLADRLASLVKHPHDAEQKSLNDILHILSNGQLTFTYHALSENRGVLTNVVNNALLEMHTDLNQAGSVVYDPLLYLPTGVIYLSQPQAPAIPVDQMGDRVVAAIRSLCAGELRRKQTGFGRDGKGMKYADYYTQFFEDADLMQVALDAVFRILHDTKASVASNRSENLIRFQTLGILSADKDFSFADDQRIDRIAEFGDVITRKIWGERVARIEAARKQTKSLPALPDLDLVIEVAQFWNLQAIIPEIQEIHSINERLKAKKLSGNTGGVPYDWYLLAARYLDQHPGLDSAGVRTACENLITFITEKTTAITAPYDLPDGWEDLRQWVQKVVILPQKEGQETVQRFQDELHRYETAKKSGRGRQLLCSISHSAYTVTEQMEAAVLFTPQVYTNKQTLGGSNAKRNISSIAGIEMMLRQILMNQTQAVGKRFEDGKYRYLYFYPTYYFTPETNKFLQKAYLNIAQTRFDTKLRDHFVGSDHPPDFSQPRYQQVDSFLIDLDLQQHKQLPEGDPQRRQDRTFKLSYPEDNPVTFYFMALPPGRDPTDTESWIMPTWLALTFPLILDVKMVVSESPIPPFTDGAEFEETVFLDGAPQAIRGLLSRDRFRLDELMHPWRDDADQMHAAPLQALTAAYGIHLDVNAKRSGKGYDANWGKFTELASDLAESPLQVFACLARIGRKLEADTPSPPRIRLYASVYYPCFDPYVHYDFTQERLIVADQSPLNHPKRLTELYRRFYRANKAYNPKANAVLKPLDVAADTLLKADNSVHQGSALVDVVAAEVCKLMDRVHSSTAEGRWVFNHQERDQERQAVLEFAHYFVIEVFEKSFKGDRGRLAGKQLNLIKNTCEFLYRLEQDQENQKQRGKDDPDPGS